MSWEMVKLGDVCEIIAGQSPESIFYNKEGEGKPFFQGKADFNEDYPTVRYFTSKVTKLARKNDILLSVRAPVGPTNICNLEACIGRGLASIRANKNIFYKYIYFHFKVIERKLSQTGNGSTFSAITTTDVKNIQIPLPPLSTQKRIAEILDKADALRKADRQLLKHYDNLAQSLFIAMFGDPVKNEKGWEVKSADDYLEKLTVGVVVKPASYYVDKGVIALRSLNIKPNEIDKNNFVYFSKEMNDTVLSKSILKEGDVVFVRTGNTGTAAIIPRELSGCNCIDLIITRAKREIINPKYLVFFFNSDLGKKIVESKEVGGIQKHFNTGTLRLLKIPVPPIALQNRFAEQIQNIEQQKEKVKAQLLASEHLFQALLKQAFNGGLN